MPYRFGGPPFFGQIFVNDTNDVEGWSEGYYCNGPGFHTAFSQLEEIWEARRQMLTSDYKLAGLRISDASVAGDSEVDLGGPTVPSGIPSEVSGALNDYTGYGSEQSAPNNVCLWLRQQAADPRDHTPRPLHGIPMSALVKGPTEAGVRQRKKLSTWDKLLTTYCRKLINLTQIVKMVTKGGGPGGLTDIVRKAPIVSFEIPLVTRYRKVGRPFRLLQGSRAVR